MAQSKNKIILFAFISVLALGGAGYFAADKFFGKFEADQNHPALTVGDWWLGGGGSEGSVSVGGETNTGESGNSGGKVVAPLTSNDLNQTFSNDVYEFSFKFPDGFSVTPMYEDSGDVFLLSRPASEQGFQVFVVPFDEPSTELTPERILADVSDIELRNSQNIVIADGHVPAIAFESSDTVLGETREIWFVWPPDPLPHGNYLYQITSYAGQDAFLGAILETWKFNY